MTTATADLERLELEVIELKKRLVAARKAVGPEPVESHALTDAAGTSVALRELFGGRRDLLVVHNMGRGCAWCTMWADGLNGVLGHLEDRSAFAVVSPNTPAEQADFAGGRGWRFARYSDGDGAFTKAMGFLVDDGAYWPGVSAFHLTDDGSIVRTARAMFGPGDDFCSTWPLFDLLAGGADGWSPKFDYAKEAAERCCGDCS